MITELQAHWPADRLLALPGPFHVFQTLSYIFMHLTLVSTLKLAQEMPHEM